MGGMSDAGDAAIEPERTVHEIVVDDETRALVEEQARQTKVVRDFVEARNAGQSGDPATDYLHECPECRLRGSECTCRPSTGIAKCPTCGDTICTCSGLRF